MFFETDENYRKATFKRKFLCIKRKLSCQSYA